MYKKIKEYKIHIGAKLMNKEIQQKNIIFYSVFLVITIVIFSLFFKTENYINFDIIHKTLQKITISQNIAPQRLFINTWRIIKNSYVDETLNNQDWTRWRIRYSLFFQAHKNNRRCRYSN